MASSAEHTNPSITEVSSTRSSSRAKRPSQKAEEIIEDAVSTRKRAKQAKKKESGSKEVFCICRKEDDGRPMVYCSECKDWFHFKCIGLTVKAAEKLSKFVCPPCQKITGKSSTANEGDGQHIEEEVEDDEEEEEEGSSGGGSSAYSSSQDSDASEKIAVKRRRSAESSPSKRVRSISGPTASREQPSQSSVAPQRKVSNSGMGASSSTAVARSRSDALRKHAQDQIINVIGDIFREGPKAKADDLEEHIKTYVLEFEKALFNATAEVAPNSRFQSAGKAYRDKLRSFLFNLKDKSNRTLRSRIALNEISALNLATMSSEELANDEIRREVERRKRENLEQSILKRDTQAPLRKLTHKGEIDIEYEAAPQPREADVADQARLQERKSAPISASAQSHTPSPPKEGNQSQPQRKSSLAHSPTLPLDFTNVWTGERSESAEEQLPTEDTVEDASEQQGEQQNEGDDEVQEGAADNFIDDFLGMPEGRKPDDAVVDAEPEQDVDHHLEPLLPEPGWCGSINMPDVGLFTSAVRHVAGRAMTDDDWKNLFGGPHAIIEGRLPYGSAIPYLMQSRIAPRTELIVMTVEPSWEPEKVPENASISSKEDNVHAFARLIKYFSGRERYGVLQLVPGVRGRAIKDFYMAALPKDVAIPEWFQLMDSSHFQGERSQKREQDLFLLVAVLFKHTPSTEIAAPKSSSTPMLDDSKSPSHGASHNVASLLTPGSSTLQDLLKAVGGSRSPAPPSNMSPHDSAPPPLNHAGPTVKALGDMPKSQLETMLTQNPSLVDNLLKTLGHSHAAASPSAAAHAPPSGPPPGPPPARPPQIPSESYTGPGAPPPRPYGYSAVGQYSAPYRPGYGPPSEPYASSVHGYRDANAYQRQDAFARPPTGPGSQRNRRRH